MCACVLAQFSNLTFVDPDLTILAQLYLFVVDLNVFHFRMWLYPYNNIELIISLPNACTDSRSLTPCTACLYLNSQV